MNGKSLVLASLVYFHRGDYIPAYEFTHYPCEIDKVYIAGLNANNVYLSDGYNFIYEDDRLISLCPDNTSFKIYNKENDEYLETIYLRWKTNDCESNNYEIASNFVETEEKEDIKGPDEIVIEKGSNSDEIINEFHAYAEGVDITNTLQYEEINTDMEGHYEIVIEAGNNLQKEVIVEVVNPQEENIKNKNGINYKLILIFIILIGVIILCVKFI